MRPTQTAHAPHHFKRAADDAAQQRAVAQLALVLLWQLDKVGEGVVRQDLNGLRRVVVGLKNELFSSGSSTKSARGLPDRTCRDTSKALACRCACQELRSSRAAPQPASCSCPTYNAMARRVSPLTRLHSVPSPFQFVTFAVTFRNMGNAWRPTTSAASRKLEQRPICGALGGLL